MTKKTIDDVYEAVLQQNVHIHVLITKFDNLEEWKKTHDEKDEKEHENLHKRISNVKFGNMLVTVFSAAVAIFTGSKIR